MNNAWRTRSRSDAANSRFTWEIYGSDGSMSQGGIDLMSNTGSSSSMTDEPHPGYRKRRADGEIIFGDMVLSKCSRTFNPGTLQQGPFDHDTMVGPAGARTVYRGDFPYYCELATLDLTESPNYFADVAGMTSLALTRAYSRIDPSTILSGETLGDLGATAQMLLRPLGGARDLLARMVKHRRRLTRKTAMSAIKANADTWLEYRYGWAPLMMDCDAISDLIVKKREKAGAVLVARAEEKVSFSHSYPFANRAAEGQPWRFTGSSDVNHEVRVGAGVLYVVKHKEAAYRMSHDLGLDAKGTAMAAWELLPYSFVVDWFVNIGPWLQATLPIPDVTILNNWVTVVDSKKVYLSSEVARTADWPPIQTFRGSGGQSLRSWTSVTRNCGYPLPPTPVLTRNAASVLHAIDGVSLAAGPVMSLLKSFRH